MNQESWKELQNCIEKEMEKEVYLMRELLSNMHQEEVSLMLQDKAALAATLDKRSSLLETLGSLRKNKQTMIKDLHGATPYFPSSIEMDTLYEQLNVLSEKIHRQFTTNRKLTLYPDRYLPHLEYLHEKTKAAQKTKVITLQINK
ncbi:MAG: hypothetical protein RLZZ453_814 [Chlamydiota bacterium]|jgi:hypothetical protein